MLLFLEREAYIGQQEQRVGRAILAKGGFAQQPARGLCAEGVSGLVGRGQQLLQTELARGLAVAAGQGPAQQLGA